MKIKIFGFLMVIMCLSLVGCNTKTLSIDELYNLQEEITGKVSSVQNDYNNFASCYVDEENKVVIVELVDNSSKQQDWFRKNIVDSKHIKFAQGGVYTTSDIEEQLNDVNSKIIKYFSKDNVEYNNLSFNYIDMTNKIVVVGLLENNLDEQEKFKEMVIDSKLITFVQGEQLMDKDDYIKNNISSKINCIESLLGGYITSEVNEPREISLNDIIEVDMTKLEYSKVKVTDNDLIYIIISTNDNEIINNLNNYFNEKYSGYQKEIVDNNYYIYVYNGSNDFNLNKDLISGKMKCI